MKNLLILTLIAITASSCYEAKMRVRSIAPAYGGSGSNGFALRENERSKSGGITTGWSADTKSNMKDEIIGGQAPADPKVDKVGRLVIYNANFSLVTKTPDSVNVRLAEIAKRYDGYTLTLGSSSSVIRVKSEKLHDAIADISHYGKIKDKVISGDDVSDEYRDFEIRLENASKARKRYLELLAKAENVEATLHVEKELERLNGEIDMMEGRLNRMKHLIEYSTITIYIEEKTKLGIFGYITVGLYDGIKWLFVRN